MNQDREGNMTPEENEKRNNRLKWLWIMGVGALFSLAMKDACEQRGKDPALEQKAFILSCDAK
ncbi:hypothetical protein C9J01_18955 [Photobacterium rosenbergii]|uniref:Uncharacterized protein n=2 Tax=Photobacterium rosenbergii TaxID=294936 RepID=A0A2T3N9S4_9GAMM|nr:hypothetical protein C9J01_18955 [Photobacterium rosenbergii]